MKELIWLFCMMVAGMTFTTPSICADNDPGDYCSKAKEQICSAKDSIGLEFAYSHCAKTCKLCVGMYIGGVETSTYM